MAARDDFGSTAGTPRGYGGGGFAGRAGGLGNGGVGGGMGGGMMGGGAGRNGGIGNRTGLGTGTMMPGNSAFGRAGGMAGMYGTRNRFGQMGNLRRPDGTPFSGALGGRRPGAAPAGAPPQSFPAVQQELSMPTQQPVIEDVPMPPALMGPWPGQGVVPQASLPTSEYWGARMARPTALQQAVAAPSGNWNGNKTFSSYSWANDPRLGTGGLDSLGLGSYTGPNYGGSGSMSMWR